MITPRETVQAFFDRFNTGNTDHAFALVRDDVAWWVPGTLPFSGTKNKAEYMFVVGRIKAGFPAGFALTPQSYTCEGERVAVEVESNGTHLNGRAYNNRYHFLFVVKDGAIAEVKEYMDTQHLAWLIAG